MPYICIYLGGHLDGKGVLYICICLGGLFRWEGWKGVAGGSDLLGSFGSCILSFVGRRCMVRIGKEKGIGVGAILRDIIADLDEGVIMGNG